MASEMGGLQLRSRWFGEGVQLDYRARMLRSECIIVEPTPYCSCTVRLHWTRHQCIMRLYTLVESYMAGREIVVQRLLSDPMPQ